jgi:hypothetical protein
LGCIDGFIVALNLAIAGDSIDLDAATVVPLGEQLVELAVGDADHGGSVLVGADAVGEADAAVGGVLRRSASIWSSSGLGSFLMPGAR